MLRSAVEENVEVLNGRLPARLRTRARLLSLWTRRLTQVAFAASVLVITGGIGRTPDSTHAASTEEPPARTGTEASPTPAAPLLRVASAQLHPELLSLAVRRVIVDAGHGGDNLGTSSAGGLLEKDLTLDIASACASWSWSGGSRS